MSKAIYKGDDLLGPDTHLIECSICGEKDRAKIFIEDLGIGIGMSGDNYTFCMSCWFSSNLGEKIQKILDISDKGLKYQDEVVEYQND